jgi:hypothetical protein
MNLNSKHDALTTALNDLSDLARRDLVERWCETFDAPPPKNLSSAFMIRALSYEVQCEALGGVPNTLLRQLRAIASGKATGSPSPTSIKPGTHLMREWNGRTYQVEVTVDGFVLDGTTFRSLSAIAKRITGAQWSGPRFFGLAT